MLETMLKPGMLGKKYRNRLAVEAWHQAVANTDPEETVRVHDFDPPDEVQQEDLFWSDLEDL